MFQTVLYIWTEVEQSTKMSTLRNPDEYWIKACSQQTYERR